MVDRLDSENLGRGIVISHKESDRTAVNQTDTGFFVEQQPGEKRDELVGYSLPLKDDDTQHLVVFKDGTMLVTEPSRMDEKSVVECYKRTKAANSLPNIFDSTHTLSYIIDGYKSYSAYLKTVTSNDQGASAEQFDTYFDQALQVATARKAEREQAQRTTMSSFVDKFDAFFKRDNDTPSTQSATELPPSSEPPQSPQGDN